MNLMKIRWRALLPFAALLAGCSNPAPVAADAATDDRGAIDAGPSDAPDAGPSIDRAPVDGPGADAPATDVPADARDGAVDAGSPCAGAVEGAACATEGQSCGGPCGDPCQFCNILRCSSGRWTRLEVFPRPCVDGGESADADASGDGAVAAGGRMLWQAPGGFAGTGPAVMVDADGTVRVWDSARGVDLASPSTPTRTLAVTPAAAADLFARWAAVDRSGLPHGGASADCYGRATFRACPDASCREETVMFNTAAQITPEMDPVRQWFDDRLGGDGAALALPSSYCRF